MLRGYGWCLLRALPPPSEEAEDAEAVDQRFDSANEVLWRAFRRWMSEHESPWLTWQFQERSNNDSGVLTFSVSRNHRSSVVWDMLHWIAEHGLGSYGLFYVQDDEDKRSARSTDTRDADYSNVFRVHRILHGEIGELDDPFFGPLAPSVERR